MDRQTAADAAKAVMALLAPEVERIRVAGSLRREKDEVKDIEIVYVPKMVSSLQNFLFKTEQVPATEARIYELMQTGVLRLDQQVLRNGPKYKRVIHVASGAAVDLFRADAVNWGAIFAIRTGPAEFSKALVSHEWQGGVMPVTMAMQGGYLWRDGDRVATPTEEMFFEALGLPLWPAEARTIGRLREYARCMALVAGYE